MLEEHLGVDLKNLKQTNISTSKSLQYRMGLATQKSEENIDSENNKPDETIETLALKIVQEKYLEALGTYAANPLYSYFEASCCLKLAQIFVELGPNSSIHSLAGTFDRHTKVSKI